MKSSRLLRESYWVLKLEHLHTVGLCVLMFILIECPLEDLGLWFPKICIPLQNLKTDGYRAFWFYYPSGLNLHLRISAVLLWNDSILFPSEIIVAFFLVFGSYGFASFTTNQTETVSIVSLLNSDPIRIWFGCKYLKTENSRSILERQFYFYLM